MNNIHLSLLLTLLMFINSFFPCHYLCLIETHKKLDVEYKVLAKCISKTQIVKYIFIRKLRVIADKINLMKD